MRMVHSGATRRTNENAVPFDKDGAIKDKYEAVNFPARIAPKIPASQPKNARQCRSPSGRAMPVSISEGGKQ